MRIGLAKEMKPDEYRVALTPAGARKLVQGDTRSSLRPRLARAAPSVTLPTRRPAPRSCPKMISGKRRVLA